MNGGAADCMGAGRWGAGYMSVGKHTPLHVPPGCTPVWVRLLVVAAAAAAAAIPAMMEDIITICFVGTQHHRAHARRLAHVGRGGAGTAPTSMAGTHAKEQQHWY